MLKLKRSAYLHKDCVCLEYRFYKEEEYLRIYELWKIFPSLSQEEIGEIFKEVRKKFSIPECRYWSINNLPSDIEVEVEKDKEKIKEVHKKIMCLFKEFIQNLEKKEKERSLGNWLWKEKTFKIKEV